MCSAVDVKTTQGCARERFVAVLRPRSSPTALCAPCEKRSGLSTRAASFSFADNLRPSSSIDNALYVGEFEKGRSMTPGPA